MKKLFPAFIAIFLLIGFSVQNTNINEPLNNNNETSACRSTSNGLAIDWHRHNKLNYSEYWKF